MWETIRHGIMFVRVSVLVYKKTVCLCHLSKNSFINIYADTHTFTHTFLYLLLVPTSLLFLLPFSLPHPLPVFQLAALQLDYRGHYLRGT